MECWRECPGEKSSGRSEMQWVWQSKEQRKGAARMVSCRRTWKGKMMVNFTKVMEMAMVKDEHMVNLEWKKVRTGGLHALQ